MGTSLLGATASMDGGSSGPKSAYCSWIFPVFLHRSHLNIGLTPGCMGTAFFQPSLETLSGLRFALVLRIQDVEFVGTHRRDPRGQHAGYQPSVLAGLDGIAPGVASLPGRAHQVEAVHAPALLKECGHLAPFLDPHRLSRSM